MSNKVTLAQIQSEVKAPKGNFNSFGKYKYRSAEDIVESVKPVIHRYGYFLVLTDEIIEVANRVYIKATAILSNGTDTYSAVGFAREEESKKGMDSSQVTGASSSYARKYALNGLFAIDDTKDSDATNTHGIATNTGDEDAKPEMTDSLMVKLVARFNGGELNVFKLAEQHYKLRNQDLLIIKNLNNETN
jgi:hypothetical protein